MEIDHGLNAQTLMLDEWLQNVTLAIRFPSHTPDFPIPSLYWWSPFKASTSHFEAILHVTGASYSPSYLAPRTVKSLGCQLMDVFFRSSIRIVGPFSGTPIWVVCKLSNTAAKWKGLKNIEKTCRTAVDFFTRWADAQTQVPRVFCPSF